MKLTLQTKIERDMPLYLGEIAKATGYSRFALRKLGLTQRGLPGGKIRLSDFWRIVQSQIDQNYIKLAQVVTRAPASTELIDDLRSIADRRREPRRSRVRLAA